ncbi:ATP-binding protein [Thalassotalea piscium]
MKIQNKLFLTFLAFSLLLIAMLILPIQWSISKGMIDYVNTKEIHALTPVIKILSKEYQKKNNWQSMVDQHQKFHYLITNELKDSEFSQGNNVPPQKDLNLRARPPMPPPLQNNRPNKNERDRLPPPHNKNDALYALLDNTGHVIVGRYIDDMEYSKTPITLDQETIGFLAVSKRKSLTEGYEVDFVEQQQNDLWIIALLSIGLVVLVTFPLSRHVVEPIKLIAHGMHKLTQGDYQQSIHLKRQDELGELSRDYNELALTLAENDTARKRWLANISHELRTPVAILRGELEAMLDEVRPLTKSNIASVAEEVKHLQRLIDDLNLLTSADIGGMRYRKQNENLVLLIESELEKYTSYLSSSNIKLTLDINHSLMTIFADKTRLFQLFENIINNSVKYSQASEFKITLTTDIINNQTLAVLKFEDNGIGVDDEHLPYLFEHLYRIDDSRNRSMGGSGLGLSICRHIVMAHQGEISAEKSSLGGLAIIIKLPMT